MTRYRYDHSASAVSNYVQDEVNYLLTGMDVYPKADGGFFTDNFVATGFINGNPVGVPLVLGTDFTFQNQIEPLSTIVSKIVYGKITLSPGAFATYDSVTITYRAVGSYIQYVSTDTVSRNYITNEVFNIGSFFRVRPYMNSDFFATDFIARGYPGATLLVAGTHFNYSATVQPYTDSLGINVYSHIDLIPAAVNSFTYIVFSYRAVGNFLPYDPTMSNVDNAITNEEHDIVDTAAIIPLANSAFFTDNFVAVGYPGAVNLENVNDFFFSPIYLTYAAASGREVASYIVLTNPGAWTSVKLYYKAIGGAIDATLFKEIELAGVFDKLDPLNWMDFVGQQQTLNIGILDPEEPGQSFLEVLSTKLNQIKVAIENVPNAPIISLPTSLMDVFTAKINELNQLQVEVNGIIGDLSEYGSVGQRTKKVNGTTYTVTEYDTGYTLVFTNIAGCAITIPETLLFRVWFRFVQDTNAGQLTWVGGVGVTFLSTSPINGTIGPGEICTFWQYELNKYIVVSNRVINDSTIGQLRVVSGTTLTMNATLHNRQILVFTNAADCIVTIPPGMPDAMQWREIKRSGAGKVTHVGDVGVTLISEEGILGMDKIGEGMDFIKAEDGAEKYLGISSRGNQSQHLRMKTINNDYIISEADRGYTLIYDTASNFTLTINTGLSDSFTCNLFKSNTGNLTFAGSMGRVGNKTTALNKSNEYMEIKLLKTNVVSITTNMPDIDPSLATTASVNTAVSTGVNDAMKNVRVAVRQCVLTGSYDNTSETLPSMIANPVTNGVNTSFFRLYSGIICFGDGFNQYGEKDHIINIADYPSLIGADIDSSVGSNLTKFIYITYDELTNVAGIYRSSRAPTYSINKPTVPVEGDYWYPTDHRSRGEYYGGAAWVPKLMVCIGCIKDIAGIKYRYTFPYSGSFICPLNNNTADVGHTSDDNKFKIRLDSRLYDHQLKMVIVSNPPTGYEINDEINVLGIFQWQTAGGSYHARSGGDVKITGGNTLEKEIFLIKPIDGADYVNNTGIFVNIGDSADWKYKLYLKRRF
jgi:hypothetical protein